MTPPFYATPAASASVISHISPFTPAEERRLAAFPGPVGAVVARYVVARRRYCGRGRAPGVVALISELDRVAPDTATADRAVEEYGRLTGTPLIRMGVTNV